MPACQLNRHTSMLLAGTHSAELKNNLMVCSSEGIKTKTKSSSAQLTQPSDASMRCRLFRHYFLSR
jgi:hypothetical protein